MSLEKVIDYKIKSYNLKKNILKKQF